MCNSNSSGPKIGLAALSQNFLQLFFICKFHGILLNAENWQDA